MRRTIRSHRTEDAVEKIVQNAVESISGIAPDRYGFRKVFLYAYGRALLEKISEAYADKATGGTDELGERWAPLAAATTSPKSGWGRMRQTLNIHDPRVLTLRVTDALFESLKPGKLAGLYYQAPENQLFQLTPEGIEFGSELEYAKYHHYGTRKMPARPLWPKRETRMRKWIEYAAEEATEALALHLMKVL